MGCRPSYVGYTFLIARGKKRSPSSSSSSSSSSPLHPLTFLYSAVFKDRMYAPIKPVAQGGAGVKGRSIAEQCSEGTPLLL